MKKLTNYISVSKKPIVYILILFQSERYCDSRLKYIVSRYAHGRGYHVERKVWLGHSWSSSRLWNWQEVRHQGEISWDCIFLLIIALSLIFVIHVLWWWQLIKGSKIAKKGLSKQFDWVLNIWIIFVLSIFVSWYNWKVKHFSF